MTTTEQQFDVEAALDEFGQERYFVTEIATADWIGEPYDTAELAWRVAGALNRGEIERSDLEPPPLEAA